MSMKANYSEYQLNDIFIKRGRDFYLYDSKGHRFLDLDLCKGAAVLGHKPHNINNSIKQTLNRGMWGMTIGRECPRTIKYSNMFIKGWYLANIIHTEIENILEHPYIIQKKITTYSDYVIDEEESETCLWRLYSDLPREKLEHISARFLLVPLPLPWRPPLIGIFQRVHIDSIDFEVSEVLLAGINHIIPYLIEKGTHSRQCIHVAQNRKDIFLVENMPPHSEKYVFHDLKISSNWKRKGIYVILPRYSKQEYQDIKDKFFSKGFYISPITKKIPQIITLPPCMTKHEILQWEDLMTSI